MESLDRLQCTIALDLYRTSNSIRNQFVLAQGRGDEHGVVGDKGMVEGEDEVAAKLLDLRFT